MFGMEATPKFAASMKNNKSSNRTSTSTSVQSLPSPPSQTMDVVDLLGDDDDNLGSALGGGWDDEEDELDNLFD
jgi:hypothetical protein